MQVTNIVTYLVFSSYNVDKLPGRPVDKLFFLYKSEIIAYYDASCQIRHHSSYAWWYKKYKIKKLTVSYNTENIEMINSRRLST